jgi:uncharacterized protein YlxW (UPF0749 family)
MLSGAQLMAVLIVAIVMIASVVRAKHSRPRTGRDATASAESERLREEVKQLKERLAVLERITIEKENSLEREIERLRDK